MDVNELIKLKLVHEIHTSERKSFKACRRRWDWIFRQNYYPVMTAKPLEFGTAYHAAMEVYYDPDTWTWDREIVASLAIQKFNDECEKQRKDALIARDANLLEEDVQADYDERVELGNGMLNYYFSKVAPKMDVGWSPLKVEIAFMLPIPNPETGEKVIWCRCNQCWERFSNYRWKAAEAKASAESARLNAERKPGDFNGTTMVPINAPLIRSDKPLEGWEGLPVVYAGRMDMLAEDGNGHYWIFDWKTAARIAEAGRDEFLYLDDQIGSYVWAMAKLGLPVRGFVYHEQRKAFPKPPNRNASRRLGRIFSVSKNQETSWAIYKRTVELEDTEAYEKGLYEDFLQFLWNEGTVFEARHQIHKSAAELQEIERNIGYEALDMLEPNLRVYPSSGRFSCGFCAFRQPCLEKNAQGDYQYALDTMFDKREHYYVRAEASTESKGAE